MPSLDKATLAMVDVYIEGATVQRVVLHTTDGLVHDLSRDVITVQSTCNYDGIPHVTIDFAANVMYHYA